MKRVTPTLEDSMTILRWIGMVLAVFVLIFILTEIRTLGSQTAQNHQTGLQNNTYLRATSCILSVTPAQRTDVYIQSCYLRAQSQTGVNVEDFSNK